uniref:NAD-dependent epimerase/dehydratase domain-containing protein n=1 Tax=Zea mays TaxID=4577 RepID=A0A804PQ23_MAIZE
MGFPSTPNLKLEPRPRTRRLLRCALSSEPVQPPMTVSITGATGFIGRRLVHKLLSDDHKVCILTRSASKAASVFPASTYPGLTIAQQGDWEACVRGSTAVVNLAGMPISTRWSPEIKQEIKQSRVNVTSKVVKYINHAGNADTRPSVFVSATAIGYYGTSEIHSFDESSPSGNDYLAEVCREWEATACQVNQEDVRLVLLRIGVVLGKDGGALGCCVSFNSFSPLLSFYFPSSREGPFQSTLLIHLVHLSICSKDDTPFYDVCWWSSGDGTPMVASLSCATDL